MKKILNILLSLILILSSFATLRPTSPAAVLMRSAIARSDVMDCAPPITFISYVQPCIFAAASITFVAYSTT